MPSVSPGQRKRSAPEKSSTRRDESGLHAILGDVARERDVGRRLSAVPTTEAPARTLGSMPFQRDALPRMLGVWARHFTLRSFPLTAGVIPLYAAARELAKLGQRLDDRHHPEWRNQPIDRPIFMFANARSGTTLLHRLMALDEERFATIKLYQTIFPTVSIERFITKLRTYDGLAGRALALVPRFFQSTMFSGWQDVHPLILEEPEEDECLFCWSGHSQTFTLLFPHTAELEDLFFLDRHSREDRDALMGWYEATLKRFLYANGPTKRLLNKNVFTAPRLMTLHERFPDAAFIYLVRHPYESLGSYMDMWYRAWRTHHPEIAKDSPEMRQYVSMALSHYRYALSCRARIPKDQLLVVQYEDLVNDPAATVERVYRELGMEVSPAYRAKLVAATEAQKTYKSPHEYRLEDFGVTREWLRAQLPEVYDEFGYTT